MAKAAHEARLLAPEQARFERSAGGLLALSVSDSGRRRRSRGKSGGDAAAASPDPAAGTEFYGRVNLFRSFPLSAAMDWISVRDAEGEEIGMLERLDEWAPAQRELIEEELGRRYFTPTITTVDSLKEEYGYSYWEVGTEAGPRRFTVQSGKNNIQLLADETLLIVDVDGNRFTLPDYPSLDAKVLRTIETIY